MSKIMVALITPFTKQNRVDYDALAHIIERLLQEGADGFVVCGTTAETPTLMEEEKLEILRFVIEKVKHRCEIWMGCGSNCTASTCSMIRRLNSYDIDGYLLVVPYYNKPSQQGIYQHFAACAHVVKNRSCFIIFHLAARWHLPMKRYISSYMIFPIL